jgi:hypothetical protein
MTQYGEDARIALRRRIHDTNTRLFDLVDDLVAVDTAALDAVRQARASLFEAWTILCEHQADDDDDH